jgi:raffinose/stachyose/melibiose transport system substrate-binding protein
MKLTRRTLVAAAVAAAALTLTACGGGNRPGGTGAAPEGGFSAWALTGGSEAAFRASFDDWNSTNSSQKVNAEFFANDAYKEKIRTAVGSGNAPTLIYSWAGGTLNDYVKSSKVVDLTSSTSGLQQRIIPAVLDNGKVDGKVYAVPNNNAQPVVLYYNRELMSKAGIAGPPQTFDELLADVQKLKAAGVDTPIALAGQSQWPELMWIEYLADRVGGPEAFKDVLAGKPEAWSNPDMLKALGMIQQLVKAGAFGDKYGSVVADSSADVALVHTGKAGMLLQGAWVYSNFLTDSPQFVKAGKLGWTTFPAVAGGKGDAKDVVGNPANFWSVSAAASKEQQAAAIKYLNEAVFNDANVDSLIKAGTVPVTTDARPKLASSEQGKFLTFVYDMVQKAPSFQLSWDQALTSGQAQTLLTNLSQVFLGQQTPEQFAEAMKAGQ